MNLMTFNKIFGAATAALLVYLLATYVSRTLFTLDEPRVLAYGLEIEGAEPEVAADAGDSAAPSLPVLLASADLSAGESQFKKCAACHKLQDGANAVGPHLWGIVGRDVQAVDGFNYSGALAKVAEVWDFDTLYAYLENPKAYAPGTSMAFAGLRKPADRANLIAYLNDAGGSNLPVPEPVAAVAAVEPEPAAEPSVAAETPAVAEAAPAEEAPAAGAPAAVAEAAPAEQPAAAVAEAAPAEEAPAAAEPAAEAPVVVAEAAPVAPAPKPLTFAEALAQNDVDRGAAVFQTCAFCHVLEENRNGIGPSLYGLVGREVASVPFYPYSAAMAAAGGVWSLDRLDAYLSDPAGYVPGVKMAYPGLRSAADRAAVLAYIAEVSGAPLEGAVTAETAAEPAAAEEVVAETAPAEAAPAEAAPAEVAPAAEAAPAAEVAATPPAAEEKSSEGAGAPAAEVAPAAEAPTEPETPAVVAEEPAPVAEAPAAVAEAPAAAPTPAAEPAPEQQVAAATPAPAPAPAPAAPAAPAGGVSAEFAAAYAAATEKDGQSVFRKCQACHKLAEGQNGVGPSLWGVVGRDKGSVAGFKYSDALMGLGGQWDYESLNAYLENPKAYAPGNRMAFAGLRKIEERAAVIRYLNDQSGSTFPAP